MKRTKAMTSRQKEIYEFIRDKIRTRGYGPTVREIGDQFGINSPNGVVSHLRALQKKGMIVRHPGMSRAIELVKEGPMALLQMGVLTPGEALEEAAEPERVDFGPLFHGKDTVVLQVKGKAMADDHVADGDYVIVERRGTAKSGQAVAVILQNGNVAVGRFRRDKDRVRLEPLGGKGRSTVAKKPKIYGAILAVVRMC